MSPCCDSDRSNCVEGGRVDSRIDTVATALRCSHCLALSIMHDCLKFRKVYTRWVPKRSEGSKKINRKGLSSHVLRNADEGEHMRNRTVTGNEPWIHYYQPESKRASVQWKHPSSPSTISWEGYAYRVLGFSGSTASPFSEA
jgi:hypothetical protein